MGYWITKKLKMGFEHPLIIFDLSQDPFRTNKIRLTFTKKLSSLLQ